MPQAGQNQDQSGEPVRRNLSAHLHFEMRWDESLSAGGTNGYGCSDSSTGTFDPSEFIDSHRTWP